MLCGYGPTAVSAIEDLIQLTEEREDAPKQFRQELTAMPVDADQDVWIVLSANYAQMQFHSAVFGNEEAARQYCQFHELEFDICTVKQRVQYSFKVS